MAAQLYCAANMQYRPTEIEPKWQQRWVEARVAEIDVSARVGVEFEKPDTSKRRVLLLVEYYRGHSPPGQFFIEKIEHIGLGLHFHF